MNEIKRIFHHDREARMNKLSPHKCPADKIGLGQGYLKKKESIHANMKWRAESEREFLLTIFLDCFVLFKAKREH